MDIHEFGEQAEVVGYGGVVHRTNLRGNGGFGSGEWRVESGVTKYVCHPDEGRSQPEFTLR